MLDTKNHRQLDPAGNHGSRKQPFSVRGDFTNRISKSWNTIKQCKQRESRSTCKLAFESPSVRIYKRARFKMNSSLAAVPDDDDDFCTKGSDSQGLESQ